MSDKLRVIAKDTLLTALTLISSFGISVFIQEVLMVQEPIIAVFLFAVFLISLITEGYIYGIVAAFIGVFAVNFAFTFPYFSFNFTIHENFVSTLLMIVISLITSTLTTQLKKWRAIKAEGEREMLKANLLRAVSHDLRTPLTTIYGSSSAILDSYDILNEEQKKKLISGIKEDSEWLIRMVENLLSITRIDNSGVQLIKTPTVLEELIDSVLLKFKKRYPSQKVDIDLPDDVVMVPMDALLIEQVIINILENAVQHAVGMTKLVLKVFVIDGKAIFEVFDNGCGIENDRLEKIFTGYYDSSEPYSDMKKRNAGIGLSVCAAIVKAHGGSIKAENAKGGGAIFRFTLSTEVNETDAQQ